MGCQYRFKYEDLRKSVFKNDDLKQDLKESLSGWSKQLFFKMKVILKLTQKLIVIIFIKLGEKIKILNLQIRTQKKLMKRKKKMK